MKRFSAPSDLLLLSSLALLTACQTGDWGATPNNAQGDLVSCAQSNSVLSTAGAEETLNFLDALPFGKYTRANFEVYENYVVPIADKPSHETKVQFLVLYAGAEDAETSKLSLRCRETVGKFTSYSDNVTVPDRLVHKKNGFFDTNYKTLSFAYPSATNSSAALSEGGADRDITASDLTYSLGRYWTSGTTWVRRRGDVFEFHGYRTDGARRISVVATYLRKDLP